MIYWWGYFVGRRAEHREYSIKIAANLKDYYVAILNKTVTAEKGARWN